MSRDVLAICRLFSSRIYEIFFIHSECSSVVEIIECSKKALFCSDFCDRNQTITLIVFVLVNPIFI